MHKEVLRRTAKKIYQQSKKEETKILVFEDEKAETLQILQSSMYKGFVKDMFNSLEQTIAVLKISNKYGFTQLKLRSESEIVEKFLDENSCLLLLPMAECLTCPLLTEACMEYFKKNSIAVVNNNDYEDQLKQLSHDMIAGLLKEFSLSLALSGPDVGNTPNVSSWNVGALRDEIFKRTGRLSDLDGTKETLVTTVEELVASRKRSAPP